MEEKSINIRTPLSNDFVPFDSESKEIQSNKESAPLKNEYYYLGINALSVVTNGINHFHFKYMKKVVGDGYNDYSFTIWRCLFIILTNYSMMKYKKETLTPFSQLKGNVWFWIRVIIQFVALETMLLLVTFFRVSTATCFISMAPLAIIIMSTVLLHEKFYMRYVYGLAICFSGVLLIVLNEKKENATGIKDEPPMSLGHLICGFFCGLSQLMAVAVHKVSSKVLIKQKIDINTQLMYPSMACIILSIIFIPLTGKDFKCDFLLIFHSFLNCLIWLLSTILTLVSFKGIDLIKTTAIGYINIITVFILGIVFLGEKIFLTDVIGSLLILGFNIYNTMYPPTS